MQDWPAGISAITLFTEDLARMKQFYATVFGLPVKFEDESSAVYGFGDTLVNILRVSAAPELIQPAAVASPDAGTRDVFTISVADVDATCRELASRGIEFLNGPLDRPWGVRTAAFADPAGHVWEIAGPVAALPG